MRLKLVVLSLLCSVTLYGQVQTPINNGLLQSDLNAAGFKILSANLSDYAGVNMTWNAVTGKFDATGGGGGGGTGTVTSITATTPIIVTPSPLIATGVVSLDPTSKSNWDTAFTDRLKWDGGSTGLVAATGRTSLGLVIGTNVEAWDADLDNLAAITGNSKFAFRNSSGVWQARGLGTNLTDDGTNINSAGGGGGIGGSTGATDRAILLASGTGGATLQNSVATIDTAGVISDAGTAPTFLANGAAANIDLTLTTKGTGWTMFGGQNISALPASSLGHGLAIGYNLGGSVGEVDFLNMQASANANELFRFTDNQSYQAARIIGTLNGTFGAIVLVHGTTYPATTTGFFMPAVGFVGWNQDTALYRNAAGIVEVNNGTAGSYRDILARGIRTNAVAFASRIASPVEGTYEAFTDSTTNTSGATITGGGSNHVSGYYNGTNWVVDSGVGAGGGGTIASTTDILKGDGAGNAVALGAATGVATFLVTPSSANLRSALTDENGTGAALFNSATTPDFTTGITIGGAAASGKILIGNGTNFVASANTYPNASAANNKLMVSDGTNWVASTATIPVTTTPGNGKVLIGNGTNWVGSTPTYPNTAPTAGYKVTGDGTNFNAYPTDLSAASTATVSAGYSADTYLAGSLITVAAGDFKAAGQYHCVFDMTKTGAGVATPIISVRVGTAGTTADTAVCTLTFSAGTGVIDSGMFEVYVNFRTVGSGTSAVFQAIGTIQHQNGVTGLVSKTSDYAAATSSGFATNAATKIGISFNGGSSFSGTNLLAQAQLLQP